MALFSVNLGEPPSPHRPPPARPNGLQWTLLALAPLCMGAAALGQIGSFMAGIVVFGGFFYACWIVGRWLFFCATAAAGRAAGVMPHAYPPPHYPPNPYPNHAYPPQQQGYPTQQQPYPPHYAPPSAPPYEPQPQPQGYSWPPRGDGNTG